MTNLAGLAATHAAAFTVSRPWGEAEIAELLAHPACFVIGDARSFAIGRTVADEAELLTLATHPIFQRRGLARACMSDWQATAVARGALRAFLEVAQDNIPAISLYHGLGFYMAGQRHKYYTRPGNDPVDALLMRLDMATRNPPNPISAKQKSG